MILEQNPLSSTPLDNLPSDRTLLDITLLNKNRSPEIFLGQYPWSKPTDFIMEFINFKKHSKNVHDTYYVKMVGHEILAY